MTRVMKLDRKYRIWFDRTRTRQGHMDIMAATPEEAIDKFEEVTEEDLIAGHPGISVSNEALTEYEWFEVELIELNQER